ncbi:MAG: hypothetical protein NVS2B4_02760 [Ramlibacter sp.]
MMTSLAAALAMFLSAIPKIIGFVVILVVAWLLSALVEKGVAALLRAVKFNDLARKAGLADFVGKMGTNTDSAGMIGLIAKWFIRIIGLVVAFDALGLPAISDVLRELLLWLPNVVVALVVLVIGGLAAKALGNLVRGATAEAGMSSSNVLSKVAASLVWAFAIVVAVNQIGIATTLVNTLFMAFVGAIALGLGLAFGLGGRETAGQIVSKWYSTAQAKSGQIVKAADAGSRIASEQAANMTRGGGSGSSGSGPGGSSYPSTSGMGSTAAGSSTLSGSADGLPRATGAVSPQDNQMYPTPSAPRHPSEGA